MIQAYKKFWQGTFVFNKRTSRKDFWMALFTHLIIFVVLLKGYNFFNGLGYFQLSVLWQSIASFLLWLLWIYFLGSLLAFLAITVRRFALGISISKSCFWLRNSCTIGSQFISKFS